MNPLVEQKLSYVITKSNQMGFPVSLFQGWRSPEEQHKLFLIGRDEQGNIVDRLKIVTNADAWKSWHNYGLAGDLVFKVNGNWSWDSRLPWQEIGEIGKEVGLMWGGWWKFIDLPHFEYTNGLSIFKAEEIGRKEGIEAVWEVINKNYENT